MGARPAPGSSTGRALASGSSRSTDLRSAAGFVYTYSQCAVFVPKVRGGSAATGPGSGSLRQRVVSPDGWAVRPGPGTGAVWHRCRPAEQCSGGRAHGGRRPEGTRRGSGLAGRAAPLWEARRGLRAGRDLYHCPAERSSRRPSPLGAGDRAVRVFVAYTTTRLSGARGGRARWGQATGLYL
jgi:hypothetical protein